MPRKPARVPESTPETAALQPRTAPTALFPVLVRFAGFGPGDLAQFSVSSLDNRPLSGQSTPALTFDRGAMNAQAVYGGTAYLDAGGDVCLWQIDRPTYVQ